MCLNIPMSSIDQDQIIAHLARIAAESRDCHPKAVLLFGSAAAFLENPLPEVFPHDLDILLVSNNTPQLFWDDIRPPVELHRYRVEEMIGIARSLRYDIKALAVSKLYAKNVIKQHARDVIAASLLLGPDYNDFGIQQIEIDGRTDGRDYSLHKVLAGDSWWRRLTRWARQRRGPLMRMSDKLGGIDRFE
jgi:hypothetical protein